MSSSVDRVHVAAICLLITAIGLPSCEEASPAVASAPSPIAGPVQPVEPHAGSVQDSRIKELEKDLLAARAPQPKGTGGAETACQADLQACTDQLASAKASEAGSNARAATCTVALDEAKGRILELEASPEMRATELVERFGKIADVTEAKALQLDVEKFVAVHGATPHGKSVKGILGKIKKKLAALEKEEQERAALAAISEVRELLVAVNDGSRMDLAAVVAVADHLVSANLKFAAISALPRTTVKEAVKEADAERGKAMVVSGVVMQISRDGDYYQGQILKPGRGFGDWFNFVTPGTSKGIYEGKNATFAGVFTQVHEYPTRGGGSNQALVLVGHFKGQ